MTRCSTAACSTATIAVDVARSLGQTTSRLADWQVDIVGRQLVERGVLDPDDPLGAALGRRARAARWPSCSPRSRSCSSTGGAASSPRRSSAGLGDAEASGEVETGHLTVGFADQVGLHPADAAPGGARARPLVERFESRSADIVVGAGGRADQDPRRRDPVRRRRPGGRRRGEPAPARPSTRPTRRSRACGSGSPPGVVVTRRGDVFGTTVNLASRLTAVARPDTVLVDGVTADVLGDVRGAHRLRPLGPARRAGDRARAARRARTALRTVRSPGARVATRCRYSVLWATWASSSTVARRRRRPPTPPFRMSSLIQFVSLVAAARDYSDLLRVMATGVAARARGVLGRPLSIWERDRRLVRTLVNVGDLGPLQVETPVDEVYRLSEHPLAQRMTTEGIAYVQQPWAAPRATRRSSGSSARGGEDSCLGVPVLLRGPRVGRAVGDPQRSDLRPFTDDDLDFAPPRRRPGGRGHRPGRARRAGRAARLHRRPHRSRQPSRLRGPPRQRLRRRTATSGRAVGVIVVDVNGLKRINDRLGHVVGDSALLTFAGELSAAASSVPGSLVARLGGDEFCLLTVGRRRRRGRAARRGRLPARRRRAGRGRGVRGGDDRRAAGRRRARPRDCCGRRTPRSTARSARPRSTRSSRAGRPRPTGPIRRRARGVRAAPLPRPRLARARRSCSTS